MEETDTIICLKKRKKKLKEYQKYYREAKKHRISIFHFILSYYILTLFQKGLWIVFFIYSNNRV